VTVVAPAGTELERDSIGPDLGAFRVFDGRWQEPVASGGVIRWSWIGQLAAFEVGGLEVPALEFALSRGGVRATIATEPARVEIRSVLPAASGEEKRPELADLKPPATIEPDFRPLVVAAVVLCGLLLATGIFWWLHRRYASRFAAVPAPTDPFKRLPPHVWAYAELQKLLERRVSDATEVAPFFSDLSRIIKLYLGGRYRVDLLELTTAETLPRLLEVGIPDEPLRIARELLERCDRVKFARELPEAVLCRACVDAAYRVVDATKPAEDASGEARRGAA
jgi:hypothetical protein